MPEEQNPKHKLSGSLTLIIIGSPHQIVGVDILGPMTEEILRYGIPQSLLSDQRKNFLSELVLNVWKLLHIKKLNTTPYHPQTDGIRERFNRTIATMIARYSSTKQDKWETLLPYMSFTYRKS